MFGNNPKRSPVKGDGSFLEVQEIFSTFQGEGPYTGWPAIFIRLGGCNLACSFCDTEFESFTSIALDTILDKIALLHKKQPAELIVLTGGEPFRQPLALLCEALHALGFKIQIETNGTLYQSLLPEVDIICSPKNTGRGYAELRSDILERLNGLKFILSERDSLYREVGEVGQSRYDIPVYVQPMDEYDAEQNRRNIQYVVDYAAKHGYRLSLQTHKILQIP